GYYASFCYLRTTYFGNMDSKEIHKYLDMAQSELDKVINKGFSDSEINVLQAHIYQLRITDMSMGMKYSTLANESIATAEKLNPENPRVYYLKGTNIFYTPEAFGGGAKNAKPLLEKAAKMFENNTPANDLMPTWGAEHNAEVLAQCGTTD
ncbi:MAG: hypothetical protein JW833_09630, partial [Prolixibacteraceae bacterium]|nr:hypothetical protein [Prolixibacteraceae bacterium]